MIVGLGGHIDHGKSALVHALTGHAMDPLPEERRRGITVDLHVVRWQAPSGAELGLVDVPGHEGLVRTMVAGASGTDVLLLVVAADEGVMPQTREHLAVAEALGVSRGLAVVTKADLVDPEWLEMATADLATLLAASPIAFGPPVVTSARTGQGLVDLATALEQLATSHRPRAAGRPFRLDVDRAMAVPGQGSVVTGTVRDGTVIESMALSLLPGHRPTRARSVQVFGAAAGRATAGQRAGIAVPGVPVGALPRGTVVVEAGSAWRPAWVIDARLALAGAAPAGLPNGSRVRVLSGTQEVMARVAPRASLQPGGAALARLRLEGPLTVAAGDRLVLRRFSPAVTLGGGEVLDPCPPPRAPWPAGLDATHPIGRLAALAARRMGGLPDTLLPILLPPGEDSGAAARAAGLALAGGAWFTAGAVATAMERAQAAVIGKPGASLAEVRRCASSRSAALAELAVARLVGQGRVLVEAGRVRLPGRPIAAPAAQTGRLIERLEQAGLAGLDPARGPVSVGPELVRAVLESGRAARLPDGRLLAGTALEAFRATLAEVPAGQQLSVARLRELTGLPRRLLVPLLEWADAQGWTRRLGDVRVRGPVVA